MLCCCGGFVGWGGGRGGVQEKGCSLSDLNTPWMHLLHLHSESTSMGKQMQREKGGERVNHCHKQTHWYPQISYTFTEFWYPTSYTHPHTYTHMWVHGTFWWYMYYIFLSFSLVIHFMSSGFKQEMKRNWTVQQWSAPFPQMKCLQKTYAYISLIDSRSHYHCSLENEWPPVLAFTWCACHLRVTDLHHCNILCDVTPNCVLQLVFIMDGQHDGYGHNINVGLTERRHELRRTLF